MRRLMVVLVLSCAGAGCSIRHGPKPEDLPFAAASKGSLVEVQLRQAAGAPQVTVSGELLEVRDGSLVLLADTVIFAPFDAVRRVTVHGRMPALSGDEYRDYRERRPGPYLRHVSRYPYGAPADAMQQILRDRGQALDSTPAARLLSAEAVRFMNDARAGTHRYRERRFAVADGYRRLGPAFPGMGEHWVHPGLIVNGRFDARTPSVLCYADSAGVPTLVGVAYAVPVMPGHSPPPSPVGDHVWHEHSDAVDDETLLLIHPAAHVSDASGPRLAMFHAWIWLENPDGAFAQNNWTLPFAQLGIRVPPNITAASAHAASLLTVGEEYYMELLDVLAAPESAERRAFAKAVTTAADQARTWHAALPDNELRANDVVALERIWTDLWHALDAAAGSSTRARLAEYAGRPGHMNH